MRAVRGEAVKLPAVDQRDRKILSTALVLMVTMLVTVLFVALVLGAGVRVFVVVSGLGG